MNDVQATMKMIKWARKQGALLIKVNGVELTFPPDIDMHRSVMPAVPREEERSNLRDIMNDNKKAEKALRAAMTTDSLNQIEDQEAWFHNNRPPQI